MTASDPMPASEVVAAFHSGRLQGAEFIDALLAATDWMVGAEPKESGANIRMFKDADGVPWLSIYSDGKAVAEARKSDTTGTIDGLMMSISGADAVGLLRPGFGLQINPDTSSALHYKPHQVGMLKSAATKGDILAALTRAQQPGVDADTLRAIGNYPRFQIVVRTSTGQAVLDLAPDPKGRRLLAAFTSEEATQAYVKARAAHDLAQGPPKVITLTGEELAFKLGTLDILGVVFNCAGPGAPCALHAQLGQRVLEALSDEG